MIFKVPSYFFRRMSMLICLGIAVVSLLLFAGCSAHTFPKIKPIVENSRETIARERAQNYFIMALDYDRRGVLPLAESYYAKAYEFDPGSVVLRDLLVQKYIFAHKYQQALLLIKGKKKTEELTESEKRLVAGLYMEMQQYGKAAEAFETIKEITLSERITLGYIYERLDNVPKAIEHYKAYRRVNPQDGNVGLKLAGLYISANKIDEAESLYVYLDSIDVNKSEVCNGLGLISLLKTDTVSAIHFFQTSLLVDSTSLRAMNNLAQIYIGKGEYAKAIPFYEKMTADEVVGKLFYRKTLALLYYYAKQYEKSKNLLQELLIESVDDFELHFYLGMVFSVLDQRDYAEMEFRKTIALSETYTDAWQHLCFLALKSKDWDKALATAEEFKNKMPETVLSWRMYGYVLNIKKKHKQACEALRKALTFNMNDASVWFELGSAYERSGNYKKAADAFYKVLALRPDDDATANYLGFMWADQNKNLDSAKILIEMALNKDPENGAYLDSYAWVFYRLGELDRAEHYIVEAAKRITDDPIVYEHLGDILNKKGDNTGALEAYRRSLSLEPEDKTVLESKIFDLQKKMQNKPGQLPERTDSNHE